MFPTIAEQHAAMRRREFEVAAMMPYDTYRLYQTERPKTAAELRYADERTGRLSAAAAGLLSQLANASWARSRRQRYLSRGPDSSSRTPTSSALASSSPGSAYTRYAPARSSSSRP